jgi:hypothetical protein
MQASNKGDFAFLDKQYNAVASCSDADASAVVAQFLNEGLLQ